MEVPLLMPEFLDKALLSKACTNPRMQALHGRTDLPSMWISSVSRQMEAMCSQVTYLALITQRISGKAGLLVIHPGTARLVAAFSLTRLEATRSSPAMQQECSYPPTAVQRGSLSMKDFRNAQYPRLKHRAPTVIICLRVRMERASGENYWELERQRRHPLRPQREPPLLHQRRPRVTHRHPRLLYLRRPQQQERLLRRPPQVRRHDLLQHRGQARHHGLVRHRRRDRKWFSSAEQWAFTSWLE